MIKLFTKLLSLFITFLHQFLLI